MSIDFLWYGQTRAIVALDTARRMIVACVRVLCGRACAGGAGLAAVGSCFARGREAGGVLWRVGRVDAGVAVRTVCVAQLGRGRFTAEIAD